MRRWKVVSAATSAEFALHEALWQAGAGTGNPGMFREALCVPAGSLAALDGLRSLACVAIVVGHCMFALGFAWPERHNEWYAALDRHPWMLALVNMSEPAMDFFLVLTGFLAARGLTHAFQRGAKGPMQVVQCGPGTAIRACTQWHACALRDMSTIGSRLLMSLPGLDRCIALGTSLHGHVICMP